MKKVVLILNALIIAISGFAENLLSGTYYVVENISDKGLSCYIEFNKDGCYNICIEEEALSSSDIIEVCMLSYGKYKIKNSQIILQDEAIGFTMQFQLLPLNDIVMEKGFIFLKNKSFYRWEGSYDSDCKKPDMRIEKQKNVRNAYKQKHKSLYPLHYGIYESEGNTVNDDKYKVYAADRGYIIDIRNDNKYSLTYKKVLISVGTWKRDGNELAFFDTNLQYPFYVLISEKGLISKYLPGEYDSCLLIYKKEGKSSSKKK